MRYCDACKRNVGKKFTYGQLILMIVLYSLMVIPGILYSALHSKKCPICGNPTQNNLIRSKK